MALFDFLKPNADQMTPEEILARKERIIARAKRAGHPQIIFKALIERVVSYGYWQQTSPKWVCPGVSVSVSGDLHRPKQVNLTYGGFAYECAFEHGGAPEFDERADGQDKVSVSYSGELLFEAAASTYSDEYCTTWGYLRVTAYREGDALRNFIGAAQAIEKHHQKALADAGEENKRREAAEARKKFGI